MSGDFPATYSSGWKEGQQGVQGSQLKESKEGTKQQTMAVCTA